MVCWTYRDHDDVHNLDFKDGLIDIVAKVRASSGELQNLLALLFQQTHCTLTDTFSFSL